MPSVECYNNNLIADFDKLSLGDRQIALMFMGGAGFYIRINDKVGIMIDPYLTDCVEEGGNFKRLTPRIFDPCSLRPELLLCSHEHHDHLDIAAVPKIMENNYALLCTSPTAADHAISSGVNSKQIRRMHRGDRISFQGVDILAVISDHGELSPDAIGFVITTPYIKIYFTGDTSLCDEVKNIARKEKPDVIILPINGEYGNLNEVEAAQLCDISGAKWIIPCHFGLFVEHGANPLLFAKAMREYKKDFYFLSMGESMIIE